jgi:ABC-2 type transport system ATP-binding protein
VTEEIVRLEAATKQYGERVALREVSFSIASGESVGYLGPNGAGKSTTLRLLSGLATPTKGTVRVLGHDPVRDPVGALSRIGVLVESPGLLPFVFGRDLLEYVADVKGLPRGERATAIARVTRRMGIEAEIDRPLRGLSTGLGRRVLLASALIGDPELLLLDEPTLGLDPVARQALRALLRELRGEGHSILLSTHLLEDVEAVCGRVLFLREGTLLGDEPVSTGAGSGTRALLVRFLGAVPPERLATCLPNGARAQWHGAQEATIVFSGDEAEQSNLLGSLIRAGLPVVSAAPPASNLEERYLEKVGREEAAV